jgi:CTP:molybdopterin cytidylyltransferase MocA
MRGMVPGLVLAAGRAARMGRSKALLPCDRSGSTFVHHLVASLRAGGVEDVLVVGRPDDDALRLEVEGLRPGGAPAARFVPNPHADLGQLSSVLAGLNVADRPGVGGVLVCPVDVPLVSPGSVSALLSVFRSTAAPIVRAVCGGRHGHPVIFSRAVFDELRRADPAVGAKAVLRAHAAAIADVEVDDPAVLADIDTPEDYARIFGRLP